MNIFFLVREAKGGGHTVEVGKPVDKYPTGNASGQFRTGTIKWRARDEEVNATDVFTSYEDAVTEWRKRNGLTK